MIKRIGIIGVGLIGGSLGLAWRKADASLEIIGFDYLETLDTALDVGAITHRASTPQLAAEDVDLVVVALPLRAMRQIFDSIAPVLKPGTIVTDVASVKSPVVEYARSVLPENIPFIAGHPMAGSEKGGVSHADALLFESATYVLCPDESIPESRLHTDYREFVDLIQATGARVLVMDAQRHDRIAASVSHLPQLLAVLLMNHAAQLNDEDDAFLRLAAGGFRDMTRIASSPFEMWHDILLANEGPILDALSSFASSLQVVRNRLASGDLQDINQSFERARKVRDTIPKDSKGFLHPLADVYVYAEDKPGELLTITRTLFEAELNIKDIELLKIREGAGGAFRISFSDDQTADIAVEALKRARFIAYRL